MHNEKSYGLKKSTLIFTALFAVCTVGIYFAFIMNDKTLLRFDFVNKDSFSQRYMFIFEFKRFVANLFQGNQINTWDWSIGLGADGFAFNAPNLFNPFSWIMLLSPAKYMDIAFTATVIIRLYLTGFFFMLYARKIGLKDNYVIFGAILYTFAPWTVHASLVQATFLMATMMLPLVLLGVEKVLRRESPVLFILSVGYTIVVSFFFAYIIGIITVLYYFVRRIFIKTEGGGKEFFTDTIKFIGLGMVGIMISAFALIVTINKYFATTSGTGKEIPFFLTKLQLLRMPMKLTDWITVFGSDSMIGVVPICIVAIPGIVYLAYKKRASGIMTLLLLIGAAFPVVSSMFNFFSYPSGRWMFVLAFFFIIATMEFLQSEVFEKRLMKILITITVAVYMGYLMWLYKILSHEELRLVAVNAGLLVVLGAVVIAAGSGKKELMMGKVVPVITIVGLVAAFNVSWGINNEGYEGPKGYLARGQAQELLNETPQKVGPKIKDDGFYRIDQVDELTGIRAPHGKMNEAMYFGNRSNYAFHSSVNMGWLELNKHMGNNMGYYKRVAPNSNDNRFGLDLLEGTKYFLGNNENHDDSTNYAGYGFKKYKTIDGTEVLKNEYSIGLGCAYDKYMYESDWLKLSYADREIAMLKAVILPDGEETYGLQEMKGSEVKSGVKELDYRMTENKDQPTLKKITAKNDDEHAAILSIKGIDQNYPEMVKAIVNNGKIVKTNADDRGTERALADIKDFTMYLGTGEDATKNIELDYHGGEERDPCSYEKIVLYQVPVKTYADSARNLEKNKLKEIKFDNDTYKGEIDCKKDSILFFSITDSDGWDVLVDGEKAKKIEGANVAFVGVPLSKGHHRIDMEYHTKGLAIGIVLSVLGLVIMWFVARRSSRRFVDR